MELDEILAALEKAWTFANETDAEDRFVRPDYRRALVEAWEDISVAYSVKRRTMVAPSINLNVAMVRRGRG